MKHSKGPRGKREAKEMNRIVCLGMAILWATTSFARADATDYSLKDALANIGIDPLLAQIILLALIILRWDLVERIGKNWLLWLGVLLLLFCVLLPFYGIQRDGILLDGVLSILIGAVATFVFLHIGDKCKNDRVVYAALFLIMSLSSLLVPRGFLGERKPPLGVGIGIVIFAVYDKVKNLIRSCRRKSCIAKFVERNKKRGIEDEVSTITADDGETYCIVGLDDRTQIAVDVTCRPDKRDYYTCAWIWNDPKDGQCRFIKPDNYQILFNPDTGDLQMSGLKNINGNQLQKGN